MPTEFAAMVAIDWADQNHAWALQAGTSKVETGAIDHTPEVIDVWAAELRMRFGGQAVAVALEQSRGPLVFMLTKYEHLVIFPVHPRTAKVLLASGIAAQNLYPIEPLGYLEFNYLVRDAKAVITDSGGITEETTVLGVQCYTLRDNTERPETITIGTNQLLGTNPSAIKPALQKLFSGEYKKGGRPPMWDGQTAERIVHHICELFEVENIPNIPVSV